MLVLTHRESTPLAPHAGQTLGRPAGFLARQTLGVGRQITLPPVVVVNHSLLQIKKYHAKNIQTFLFFYKKWLQENPP